MFRGYFAVSIINVPTGPTGPTGTAGAGATGATGAPGGGALVQFGGSEENELSQFIITLTTNPADEPSNMSFLGFSHEYPFSRDDISLLDSIDIGPLLFVQPLLMPRAGNITSYSAKFIVRQLDAPVDASIHVRIYRNDVPGTTDTDEGNNTFTFVPGTDFELAPRIIVPIGGELSRFGSVVFASGFNIPFNPLTRILMVLYVRNSGNADIRGMCGGATSIQ